MNNMLKLMLVISIIMIFVVPAIAENFYYIVDINNNVIAKTQYKPSQKDLDTRNEIPVKSELNLSLGEAEYRNGKIVKHTQTIEEIKETEDLMIKGEELQKIRQRMMKDACEALVEDGVKFVKIKCSDFD